MKKIIFVCMFLMVLVSCGKDNSYLYLEDDIVNINYRKDTSIETKILSVDESSTLIEFINNNKFYEESDEDINGWMYVIVINEKSYSVIGNRIVYDGKTYYSDSTTKLEDVIANIININ